MLDINLVRDKQKRKKEKCHEFTPKKFRNIKLLKNKWKKKLRKKNKQDSNDLKLFSESVSMRKLFYW